MSSTRRRSGAGGRQPGRGRIPAPVVRRELPTDAVARDDVRALYLDVRGEAVLGLFHPARAAGPGPAVLLCPPFGREDVTSYRSRLAWATSLAAAGMPALRFDLPGTGDSAGSPHEPGRLASWIAAVGAAAAFLRDETGRARTAAIGIGLGGLLALAAADGGAALDDLVLWGVPSRGKAFLRELAAFARIESESIVAAGAPPAPPLPSGAIAPGGFVLPAETMRALERLEFASVGLRGAQAPRALLLGRDGMPPDEELSLALQAAGAEVDVADGLGYAGMMTVLPEDARLPHAVRDLVSGWLVAPPGSASAPAAPAGPAPAVSGEIELSVGGTLVRETPLWVPHGRGRLFGVLSEAIDAPEQPLTLVLLNAGAIRHVGPSRLWVELGRRWASRGVATLRIDMDGIGDSSGRPDRYVDPTDPYAGVYVEQVRAALDTLVARGLPGRFALLGLCAGGYWSFQTALVDERVSLATMINPRLLFWAPEIQADRDDRNRRRQLLRPDSWRRVLSGEQGSVVRRLLSLAALVAAEPLRFRGRARARAEIRAAIEEAFDRLGESDTRAALLFCDGEPLRDDLEAAGLLAASQRWPQVEFRKLPGRDHVLRPLWMHEHVFAAVNDVLGVELRRAPAPRHR